MAMKKKFLPLLMAGMVVVGTTGLVNADTKTLTGNDTETLQSNVSVSGTVSNQQGTAPAGKITVELPTRMAFAVDQKGNFKGGEYTVKNSSKGNIDVFVSDFQQISGNIEVVEEITQSSERGKVKLTLKGDNDSNEVNLKTLSGDEKLSTIKGGAAGVATNPNIDENGATGEFNMVFKVKANQ